MLIYVPADPQSDEHGEFTVLVLAPRRHPDHSLSQLPDQQFFASADGQRGTIGCRPVLFSSISTGFDEEGRRITWLDDRPTRKPSIEEVIQIQTLSNRSFILDKTLWSGSLPCFLSEAPLRGFHRYRVRVRLDVATLRDLPMFEAYVKRSYWELGEMYRIGNMPFGPIEEEFADQFRTAESIPAGPGTTIIVTADPDDESAPTGVLIIGDCRDGLNDAILDLDARLGPPHRNLYQTASWIEGIPDEPSATEHRIVRLVAEIEKLEPY